MKKLASSKFVKNVGSSWLGLAVNVVTGLVVSPYILHKLGDQAFGLWVLVFAITGYYGLFDFGIRSSIIRYFARFTAVEKQEELNKLVNTTLFSYSCVGLLLFAITVLGSLFVGSLFHVQPAYVHTARILFLMVGGSLAIGFPLAVFGGILEGIQRFYLLNVINIVNTILRTVLVVVVLNRDYGLLMVAFVTVVFPLINGLVNGINALRLTRVRLAPRYVNRRMFGEVVNYGSVTFMISLAAKLRFRTDAMIIGTFLSAAYVTYFAIGSKLLDYAGDLVSSLAQIFVPMSSALHAKGDMPQLRKLFVAGNRGCALIIFPISAIFLVLGKSLIEAWVGPKYIATSYPVLIVLLFPTTLMLAQAASGRILFGMAEHRTWAWIVLIEGTGNVLLSIFLVQRFGVLGDALGTAIPMATTMILFLPRHMCRLLGIRLGPYLAEAFTLPLLLCVLLTAVLIAMQRWFVPHNYLQLSVQLLIAGGVYGAGLLWAYKTNRITHVRELPTRDEKKIGPVSNSYGSEQA